MKCVIVKFINEGNTAFGLVQPEPLEMSLQMSKHKYIFFLTPPTLCSNQSKNNSSISWVEVKQSKQTLSLIYLLPSIFLL